MGPLKSKDFSELFKACIMVVAYIMEVYRKIPYEHNFNTIQDYI